MLIGELGVKSRRGGGYNGLGTKAREAEWRFRRDKKRARRVFFLKLGMMRGVFGIWRAVNV